MLILLKELLSLSTPIKAKGCPFQRSILIVLLYELSSGSGISVKVMQVVREMYAKISLKRWIRSPN